MNNDLFGLEKFYLGSPERNQIMVDEFRSADIFNIDNSSFTDSNAKYRQIQVAITDPTTAPTAGINKAEVVAPFDGVLVGVFSTLTTAATAGYTQVSLKNSGNKDILVGYSQITYGNYLSGQAYPDVNRCHFKRNEPIRVTINSVGTGAKGLIVTLYFLADTFYSN